MNFNLLCIIHIILNIYLLSLISILLYCSQLYTKILLLLFAIVRSYFIFDNMKLCGPTFEVGFN